MSTNIVKRIIKNLNNTGDKNKIESVNQYLKNKVKSRGNSNPNIYKVYREMKNNDEEYKKLIEKQKFSLALVLLKNDFIDDKLIAVSILSEIHKKLQDEDVDQLKEVIKQGNVNEWATCDTLAGKVFKPYTLMSKENTLKIANWKDDEDNIWIRRISCVAFINRVKFGNKKPNFDGFVDLMFQVCEINVHYEERFNQLATGWLLRELSLVDLKRYKEFFYRNFNSFSREGLRYSVEKLDNTTKKKLMSYRPDE